MTREFKTYGGEDLDPVVDLTEYLEWENTEFSTRSYLGESSPSTFPVRDELGVISASGATYNIGTKNRMEVILDGQVLWKGRRAKMTSNRRIRLADRDRIHDVSADDINKDLHGIVVDGWERPAETDVARVQALGAAYLAGSPRATTDLDVSTYVPNTNTVTLPAHTYNRTSPIGVLQEIAGQANKNFFVTIDDELFWDTYDSTAYATTLSISDRPADSGADGPGSDPLCYFPQWSAGPPIEFDGTTWMSGARMFWGPGDTDYVEANDTSQANLNAYWMEILNDDQSTDAASAERRLAAILARRYQGLTYHVAIGPMTDEHIKLLKPGHLINIKARVIGAANSFINRRIVDLTISTPAPGQWFAFMTLDTPHRPVGRGLPAGPRPPTPGGPALIQDTGFGKSTTATLDIQVSVASGADAIYLAIQSLNVTNGAVSAPTVTWYPNYVTAGAVGTGSQAMTEVDFATHDTNHRLSFFRLLAPTQSGTATSSVRISDADTQKIGSVWVLSGVNQSTPESDTATNNGGASASSSVSITASGLVLDAAEWTAVNAAADLPDATAGQTEDSSQNLDNSFGLWDHAMGAGHSANTGTLTWTFTNSKTEWSAIAVAINTATGGDGTPEPPGEADNGTTGSGVYAPHDHVHPPGIVSNTTPTVNDDSGDGHEVGLVWVDQSTDTAYVLVDDAVGAAVWHRIPTDTEVTGAGIGVELTKHGQILTSSGTGSEENRIDSPTIFWDHERQRWGMVYTGYSESGGNPLQASLHLAYSDDLLTWTKYGSNPILSASGSGADSNGCTGGYIYYEDGTYHLFYIGLTSNGYEAGTKSLCHATASDPQGSWSRQGSIITPAGGSVWYSDAIWHPNIVKRGDTYYLFFNATGGGDAKERIGYATATDLDEAWTVNGTAVISPTGTGADWDGEWVADPSLYRIGDYWYMAYSGKGTGAADVGQDGIAWCHDDNFPDSWTRFSGNPVLTAGGSGEFDEAHAHKPFIVSTPAGHFHFYTAIDDAGVWSFGLATAGGQREPVITPEMVQAVGRWEPVVTDPGTGPELVFDGSGDIVVTFVRTL